MNNIEYKRGINFDKVSTHNLDKILHKKIRAQKKLRVTTKEEFRQELKDKYRMAWKGSGYVNTYFSNVQPLKAVYLHPIEKARACVPVRSYKAPAGWF